MITQIKKLKNFGIYQEFSWDLLPDFKKFNLIYGWNRSGKTTISRIFSSCEKQGRFDKERFKQYPENGEFEILLETGQTIKSQEVENNNLPVKVFNQDFIEDNISFEPSKYSNGIIYVSEEDIESKKKLDNLKKENISLQQKYDEDKRNTGSKEKIKNTFLTSLGREISNILFDKTYNKAKAETKIYEIGIDNFQSKLLSDYDKNSYEEIAKRKAGENISLFKKIEIKFFLFNNVNSIYQHIKSLLQKQIVSQTLERLKNDEDLNNWVKRGYEIHKSKEEFGKCLFCQNSIDQNLFDSLSKHFSKDYIELQNDIDVYKNLSKQIKFQEVSILNSNLYPELEEEYKAQAEFLNAIIKKHNDWFFLHAEGLLDEKFRNPFDNDLVEILKEPDDFQTLINNQIDNLNGVITKHNEKVKNHSEEVKSAKETLELHSIAIAINQQDFKKLDKDLIDAELQEKDSLKALTTNKTEIDKLERESSKISGAIQRINKHLTDFFGKEEITLDLDETKKGYIIYRNGQLASNLSEGEKTAIAFSYFIVKVEEKGFQIKDGIIFIDDPISSFDSNFIYHCFTLINEHFKDTGQLFISTHNFHFFNLVKDWFTYKNTKVKEDNEKLSRENKSLKPIPCEFYMIENYIEQEQRNAKIILLDKTLKKFKSEYHFLFSRLNDFLNTNPNYADFYSIGNIARRYFEIFADFKIPNSSNQKQKMEAIVKEVNTEKVIITAVECGKVYKLINEFSHNYNPTSAIEHTDKSECMDAIKILIKIVKYSDPKHFEVLEKNCL